MDTVRQCLFLLVQIQQRAVFTRAAERFATFVHPGTANGRNPPIDKHQKHPAQFALLIAPYALDAFAQGAWGKKFPTVVASWRRAWGKVIPFVAFPPEVRRVIYTTKKY